MNCDNCGSKITAGEAVQSDDGRAYCAKCAALTSIHDQSTQKTIPVTRSVLPENSVMKFYFCETCGKRITDQQILDGLGRNKKLKGVYCKECAVGVMTMEFSAISDADLKKSVIKSADHANHTKESPPESNPQHGSRAGMLSARRSEAQPSRSAVHPHSPPQNGIKPVAIAGAIAGVLVLVGTLVLTSGSRSRRSVLNEGHPDGLPKEAVKSHPPQPALEEIANPLPVDTRPSIVQEASKTDPEILAKQDYDDMVKHVGSLDSSDNAGRLVAVEAFLKDHGESNLAKSARVMRDTALEQLNKTHASANDLVDQSGHDSNPPSANVSEVKVVTPAAVPANKGREQFASILKELAPILRQNRFEAARELLDARRRDAAFSNAAQFIDKEKADLTEINALRQRALNALRAKSGSTITLTIRGEKVIGTVVDNPGTDLALSLRDGPEMSIRADQLVAQDVDAFAPNDTGSARAEDMRRHGLLFLAAGDASRAENYFTRARDAGLDSAVEPYLERIADARLLERESIAAEAWKNVEMLYKEGKWKSSQSAIANFVKAYSSTQYAKQKQNDSASMIAEIERKIAQSEGYYFDFKTPESFSRFKMLLTPVHMDLTDANGPMELKYETGKGVFLRTGGRDWGTLQLQSDIVRLGKNWDLQIKGNFHIGDNDLISKANKIAFIALRFPKPKEKAGPNPDDQPRLGMRIIANAGYGSFQADWSKSPFDKLSALNGTGLVSDVFRNPKFKAPGRSEGIFSFKVSMRQDKIKMEVNSVPVAEYQLPPEAVSRIVDSPLALYICAWSELRQIDFEEFHFTNVDNPQDRVQK